MGFFGNWRAKRQLAEALERLEIAERKLKTLSLDFEDLYDKVRRALQRITKRAEVAERAEEQAPAEPPPEEVNNMTGYLTPRQRTLQQQIISRRAQRRAE